MDISIGILAGGKSRRMGQNKAYMKLYQKTFISTIADELSCFNELIVSIDHLHKYADLNYLFVIDHLKDIGPIEGIRQILLKSNNQYVFICATDMPFIKKELVDYMQQFICHDYDCYVIQDEEQFHPLCAIYSKSVINILETSIQKKQYSLKRVVKQLRTKYISLKYSCFSENALSNINTENDYKSLVKPIIFCISGLKNSGKTTLITQLIKEFKKQFSKITVIKHDGHDFTIDHEGTDTYQYMLAGATQISIFSDQKYSSICLNPHITIEEIIQQSENADIIIIEGMKYSNYPKVEVIRSEISDESICNPESLIAYATNTLIKNSSNHIETISLEDSSKIARTILRYFMY